MPSLSGLLARLPHTMVTNARAGGDVAVVSVVWQGCEKLLRGHLAGEADAEVMAPQARGGDLAGSPVVVVFDL